MEITILPAIMATTMYISSFVSGTPVVSQTTPVAFTHALPEKNVVAYTVNSGDTLKSIARSYYADEAYWTTLWNENPTISDPENLVKNIRIRIHAQKPAQPEVLSSTLAKKLPVEQEVAIVKNVEPTVIPTVTIAPMPVTSAPSVAPTAPATSGADNGTPSSYDAVYKEAAAKYGVSWEVLYGLHITESGGRDGMVMNGSGSGARGPMQFMPGTWKAYGADGDGDGVANIDSATDAIHGAANYLAKHGTLESGLRSYGGNTAGVMKLAHERGFNN